MKRTCKNCTYFGAYLTWSLRRAFGAALCDLTRRQVNSSMLACLLHRFDHDPSRLQQEWDENWRLGASVPLAVPEQN